MTTGPIFTLNAHADYACRRSGACCTAGWSIPVEARLQSLLRTAWLVPNDEGACPEFECSSGLCRVQRDHGEAMMPESCHHFPRRALTDDRGTSVALSLYCPTAATLLLDETRPLDIVCEPSGFPASRGYEGLDARGEWPPLLRPDALFDAESFSAWERFLVRTLGSSPGDVETTLGQIADVAERLRLWSADQAPLGDWTTLVLNDVASNSGAAVRYQAYTGADAFLRVVGSVPTGLSVPALPEQLVEADRALVAPVWREVAPLALRYLGAKAFASWTAYQSRGIRTQVAELYVAAAVLRVECARAATERGAVLDRGSLREAVRASDLLLVHLAEREPLMAWMGQVETGAPS